MLGGLQALINAEENGLQYLGEGENYPDADTDDEG